MANRWQNPFRCVFPIRIRLTIYFLLVSISSNIYFKIMFLVDWIESYTIIGQKEISSVRESTDINTAPSSSINQNDNFYLVNRWLSSVWRCPRDKRLFCQNIFACLSSSEELTVECVLRVSVCVLLVTFYSNWGFRLTSVLLWMKYIRSLRRKENSHLIDRSTNQLTFKIRFQPTLLVELNQKSFVNSKKEYKVLFSSRK